MHSVNICSCNITLFLIDGQDILINLFLAPQDALEVMRVTHSLTESLDVSIDFTDVTLVSDDTYRRLYWCDSDDPDDPDDPDERYLVMKVI